MIILFFLIIIIAVNGCIMWLLKSTQKTIRNQQSIKEKEPNTYSKNWNMINNIIRDAKDKKSGLSVALAVSSGVSAIILIILAMVSIATSANQDKDLTAIASRRDNIAVIATQKQSVEANIRSQLDKYPEIEKSIIQDIKPEILLTFPQLKSNETVVAAFTKLNDLDAEIANNQREINNAKAQIMIRERSAVVPRFTPIFITYEDFFGEKP